MLIPLSASAEGETTSPNMQLTIPAVGITSGPQWATDLVMSLDTIDLHDHSVGKGVRITPDGLDITSDLSCQSNDLTVVRSTRYDPQVSTFSLAADVGAVYVSGVDLYYRDVNGNNIRLTQSGSIVGTAGVISGLVSPASASYVPGSSTFVWQSAVNTSASLDAGCLVQRNLTASSNGITLCAPSALAANYSLTWPGALPASQKFATIDSSGNIAASWAVDNSTLEVSSNTVRIKDLGVTTAKINDGAVTQAKRAALGQQISSSCGTFTESSGGFTDVTNLSVTITTTGRPVFVGLISDGTMGFFESTNPANPNTQTDAEIKFVRDSTDILYSTIETRGESETTSRVLRVPSSGFSQIDVPSAASHTYKVQIRAVTGAGATSRMLNTKLVAYEL